MIYQTNILPDTRYVCVIFNDDGTRYTDENGNSVSVYSDTKQGAIDLAKQII